MNILVGLLGSAALLLLGMQLASEGMQKAAGARLRQLMNAFTTHRLSGLFLGTAITAVMQSSGATAVLLVSFVGSGLMQFEQTIAVLLGANIGTTVTVQLIAFRLTEHALSLVALGFIVSATARRALVRHVGRAVLGFGLIFLAIKLFGDIMSPIGQDEAVMSLFRVVGNDVLLGLTLGAVLTALVNSSAAIIGLVIVLAIHGFVTLPQAMPIVLGANIGTCFTSYISSIGAPLEARRVVAAHAIMKTTGVLLALPLLGPFTHLVSLTAEDVARQVAMGHTLYNVALSIIFLPMVRPFASFIKRVLPHNPNEEVGFQIRYLDERLLDSPILALGAANREVRRMADRVQIMLSEVMELFLKSTEESLDRINKLETELDSLAKHIIGYLSSLAQTSLTEDESRKAGATLYIVNDLEHVGDILTKLANLARKKIEQGLAFSPQGIKEIQDMHARISKNLDMAIVAFMTGDRLLAEKVVATQPKIARLERDLREQHLNRLWQGIQDSRQTSTIHLDLIYGFQRINEHAVNVAHTVDEYFAT
ncbi:MAG: Na/Pi cotransporter family protein [Candidatus Sericytochromatia bacterium]|nr:Na/Pi cotransporter family protein [Candidatus Tanganyikabacteria bacterium]